MSLAVVSFPTLFAHNETRGLFAAKLLFRHAEYPTKSRQIPFLMHIGEFVLCLSAFMAVLLILLLCLKKDRNCDTVASGRLFLGALLSIITPTRSIWPTQYSSYALRRSTANSRLSIPLRTLHRDILNDVPVTVLSREPPLLQFICDVLPGFPQVQAYCDCLWPVVVPV